MLDELPIGFRRLNVGCGFDRREGYVNVDLQSFHKPDVVANALDLHMVPSNWADEVFVYDVIEHFKRTQTVEALLEWNRVLALGGLMKLRTTYLPGLLRRLDYDWFGSLESHKQLMVNLFSSQAYEGDFHYTAFTEKLMRFYLWSCGFEIETIAIKDNWLFELVAVKTIDYSYQDLIDSSQTDRAFLAELYRTILDREPDEEGFAGKLALLKREPRRAIVKGFLCSEERDTVMSAKAPCFELEFDAA